jgi:hypothetical protein
LCAQFSFIHSKASPLITGVAEAGADAVGGMPDDCGAAVDQVGKIGPNERQRYDAAASDQKLASIARWPVTISYFDTSKKTENSEQAPAYAIGFELYENGISRALVLDYNDFVVTGKLSSLELKEPKPCP